MAAKAGSGIFFNSEANSKINKTVKLAFQSYVAKKSKKVEAMNSNNHATPMTKLVSATAMANDGIGPRRFNRQ